MNSKEFDASIDMLDFVFTDYISDLRKISKLFTLDPSSMSEQEKIKTGEVIAVRIRSVRSAPRDMNNARRE